MRDLTRMGGISDSGLSEMPRGYTPSPNSNITRTYYYVAAIQNGVPIILGAFPTREMAEMAAQEKLKISYQIIPLKTRDMNKATKQIKYQLLAGDNLDTISNHARHVIEPE